MEIPSATGTSAGANVVAADKVGFGGLTAETFMQLLVTQLKNQDPMEPVGNDELLNQLSTMRSLQSNIEMSDALKSITVNQRLSTAATFIGKAVVGTDLSQQPVTGVADRAFLRDGTAFIGIGDREVPLDNVEAVGQ